MTVLPRGNEALNVNPPIGVDEAVSVHGSDFLWAIMAIYTVAFVSPSFFRVGSSSALTLTLVFLSLSV